MMAMWTVWLLLASSTYLHFSQATSHVIKKMDILPSRFLHPMSRGNSYRVRRSVGSPYVALLKATTPLPVGSPYALLKATPLPVWPNLRDEQSGETFHVNTAGGFGTREEEEGGHREQRELNRSKRKVISRGGHYIIRSSSGSSPWSSTSYDSYSTYRTSKPRGYGWNPRGRIGDGGIRTTTFGEIIRRKPDRRSPRKKLSRSFKGEIAQYAMLYGPKKAALHYESRVGRRLKDRVVEKFVQRYQERVKKTKKKSRS